MRCVTKWGWGGTTSASTVVGRTRTSRRGTTTDGTSAARSRPSLAICAGTGPSAGGPSNTTSC